jgi:endonuclease/exonuclease/phosphatase family metal-dependent hydrolase
MALQEVWDPRYSHVERFARGQNLHVVASSAPSLLSYLKLKLFGGGLMIISKFPIEQSKEIIFDRGTHSDMFASKGALYAKINIGSAHHDLKVHVFNTHLQASYGHEFNVNNPYADIRKKQLEQLAEFINQMTFRDKYPIILMGDFNVNAHRARGDPQDSVEYTRMVHHLHSEFYQIVDVLKEFNGGVHPVTYEGKGILTGQDKQIVGPQRLDFLLELRRTANDENFSYKFTNATVVPFHIRERMFKQISDHYGASAVMQLFLRTKKNEEKDGASTQNVVLKDFLVGVCSDEA